MQDLACHLSRNHSDKIAEPFSASEMHELEIFAALDFCSSEPLAPPVMAFIESRRDAWNIGSDRKHENLLRRRQDAARHYIQIAIREIATRATRRPYPLIIRLVHMQVHAPYVLMQDRIRRYVMLATRAVIRNETRKLEQFLLDCVLHHEGPLQGFIKSYLRKKGMLGGDESLENRVLRLTDLTFDTLLDRCTEPRLKYLRWARKCGFIADSGLAYAYIKKTAANIINQATRDALGSNLGVVSKPKARAKRKPSKKTSVPYVVFDHLKEFFDQSKILREAMSEPNSPLALPDENFDAEPYCSLVSQRIFEEHFETSKDGTPDRVWRVFWARVVHGMPREEAADFFERDILWVRKRESELRRTIIKIVDEISKSRCE